jgi:hypothetical protein
MSGPEKTRAPRQNPPDPKDRAERLKDALKANMAKRKALIRARTAGDTANGKAEDDASSD